VILPCQLVRLHAHDVLGLLRGVDMSQWQAYRFGSVRVLGRW
jgi:hypothetical protein